MNHKETAAHFRKRLAAEGISARCAMTTACGVRKIQVVGATAGQVFTDAESRTIKQIAIACKLTGARRSAIDLDIVCSWGGMFEFHGI